MANNPYVNKVVVNNNTLIDLSNDTVTPEDVMEGVTFHDATGALRVGTATGGTNMVIPINPTEIPTEVGAVWIEAKTS